MFGSRNRRTISRKERTYAPRLENSRLRHCGAVCEVAALMESWIFCCGAIAPIAPQNGAYVVVAKARRTSIRTSSTWLAPAYVFLAGALFRAESTEVGDLALKHTKNSLKSTPPQLTADSS